MSTLHRQLCASLAAADAELVAEVRRRADAAPLLDEDHPVLLEASKLRTLLRLAEEAIGRRATDGAPPSIGPRGRVIFAGLDQHGDYIALIAFKTEAEVRAAGARLFTDVTIEPAIELATPANETTPPGRGVASEEPHP